MTRPPGAYPVPPPHPRPVPGAQGRWGSGGQEGGARSQRWPGPLAKALVDARQRGLQEPRERALTWPREAMSKITSPAALQGLSRAHVGLSARALPSWVQKVIAISGPAWQRDTAPQCPQRASARGAAEAGPSPVTRGLYLGWGSCRGTPHCPLSKSPLASSACQGHVGPIRQFRAFSATNPCAGPLATQRTTTARSTRGLCSLLSSSSNPSARGGLDCGRNPPCPHRHPLPTRAHPRKCQHCPLSHTASSLGLCLPHAGHHHPHNQ